jgi:hypothetical protein
MATSALTLVNGFPRMTAITASLPSIYDQSISIVSSGTPPGSLTGPVAASTAITLPASGIYTVASSVANMDIYLNGDRLEYNIDWNTSGSGPNFTAFTLVFGLVVGDRLDLRIDRNS